jgi:hypothetical protein
MDMINYVEAMKELKTAFPSKILMISLFNDPIVYEERDPLRLGTNFLGLLVAVSDYAIIKAHSYRTPTTSPYASLSAPILSTNSSDPLQSTNNWGKFVSSVEESMEAYLLAYYIDVDKVLLEVDYTAQSWRAPSLWAACTPQTSSPMPFSPDGTNLCPAPQGDEFDVFYGQTGDDGPGTANDNPLMGVCNVPIGWSGEWRYSSLRSRFFVDKTTVNPASGYSLVYHTEGGYQQPTLSNGSVVIAYEDVRSVTQKIGIGKTWAVNGIVIGDVGTDFMVGVRGELTFAAIVEYLG